MKGYLCEGGSQCNHGSDSTHWVTEELNFINLTGHNINLLKDVIPGDKDKVARVKDEYTEFDDNGICTVVYGEITGLPAPAPGVVYVTSAMVRDAAKASGRTDVVAPATGHPLAVKNEKGHILSVPGFAR